MHGSDTINPTPPNFRTGVPSGQWVRPGIGTWRSPKCNRQGATTRIASSARLLECRPLPFEECHCLILRRSTRLVHDHTKFPEFGLDLDRS